MHIELKHLSKPSYLQILIYFIVGLLLWGVSFLSDYFTVNSPVLNATWGSDNALLINLIVFGVTLINAVLLSQLLNLFSFTDTRSFIGVIVFFLLIITWDHTHTDYISHISLFLFILALFQFFLIPHHESPMEKAFLGSLFIGIASLLVKDYIFLLPVCWIGFMILRIMSLRVFLASLMGLVVPHILFLSANYIFSFIPNPLELYNYNFSISFGLSGFSLLNWIYLAFLGITLLIILVSTYSEFNKKAIHTRRNLNFTVLVLLFFIVFSVLYSDVSISFLAPIAFLYSILFTHVLSLKKNNFYSILFILFCVINVLVILYNFIF